MTVSSAIPRPARRRILLGVAGLAASASLGGPGVFRALAAARGLPTRTRTGLAFGTIFALTVAGPDTAALDEALSEGIIAMRGVEAAASLFRADSALSRLNRVGRLEAPPRHLSTILRFALDLAARTGGAFDPTVQPLWPIWARASEQGTSPDAATLRAAVARVDWRRVSLGPDRIVLEPGTELTLNALIQGYAADQVMEALRARGIADALVDTGEFGAMGTHPDGAPWRLGVSDPRAPDTITAVIAPFTGFAATSGDYNMSFSPDRADHHIFDPTTGRSPRGLSSVTVTAPSGLVADGLSTACMVLGSERGSQLVEERPGCIARFFGKS